MKLIKIVGQGSKATLRLEKPLTLDEKCKVGVQTLFIKPRKMKSCELKVNLAISATSGSKGDFLFEHFQTIHFTEGIWTLEKIINQVRNELKKFKKARGF